MRRRGSIAYRVAPRRARMPIAVAFALVASGCGRDASRPAADGPAGSAAQITERATVAADSARGIASPLDSATPVADSLAAMPAPRRSRDGLDASGHAHADVSVIALVDALNAWDVEEARLAQQKAGSAEVRRFAMDLASAHPQKVADRSVAPRDAAADALLDPLRAAQRAAMTRLVAMPPGAAFDRAFVAAQIERHERVLGTVRRLASSGGSRDMSAVLQRTVAQVEQHLREARALQQRLP